MGFDQMFGDRQSQPRSSELTSLSLQSLISAKKIFSTSDPRQSGEKTEILIKT
jgi:hypothetical protein